MSKVAREVSLENATVDDSTRIPSLSQEMEVHRAFPPEGPVTSSQHIAGPTRGASQ